MAPFFKQVNIIMKSDDSEERSQNASELTALTELSDRWGYYLQSVIWLTSRSVGGYGPQDPNEFGPLTESEPPYFSPSRNAAAVDPQEDRTAGAGDGAEQIDGAATSPQRGGHESPDQGVQKTLLPASREVETSPEQEQQLYAAFDRTLTEAETDDDPLEDGSSDNTLGPVIGSEPTISPTSSASVLEPTTVRKVRARSPKTEKKYARTVRYLWRRSVKTRSSDPQQPVVVTPLEVVQDFLGTWPLISVNTRGTYRAALLWDLAQHRDENESYKEAYHLLASAKPGKYPNKSLQLAAKKTISESHLNKLLDTLSGMNRHAYWGSRVAFWLQAGLACGLRPKEWLHTSWLDDKQVVLCVGNGKLKTTIPIYKIVGPGETIHDIETHHPERILPGSASDDTKWIRNLLIEPSDRTWVNLHMEELNGYLDRFPAAERDGRYDTYYNMCRKVLRDACIRTFGGKKLYPLYVMRSQCAANLKAKMPLADVSEYLGHESSGKTTKKDYAPRTAAHGGRGAPSPKKAQKQKESDDNDLAPPRDSPLDD